MGWHKRKERREKSKSKSVAMLGWALRAPWAVALADKRTDMSENKKQDQGWWIRSAGFT